MAGVMIRSKRGRAVRAAGWGLGGLALLVPLVAMQVTDEVAWTTFDFAFVGVLLAGVGVPVEVALRRERSGTAVAATGVACFTAVVLVLVTGAVGLVGAEGNPANALIVATLGTGIVGAVLARSDRGMARAMVVVAGVQAMVAGVGGVLTSWAEPAAYWAGNGLFVLGFLVSAALFGLSGRETNTPHRA